MICRSRLLYFALLAVSTCFGQELWNGARYGMSKQELGRLFPGRIKDAPYKRDAVLESVPWTGGVDTPEHFCGSDFAVFFVFFDVLLNKPRKALAWVELASRSARIPLSLISFSVGLQRNWDVPPHGPNERTFIFSIARFLGDGRLYPSAAMES